MFGVSRRTDSQCPLLPIALGPNGSVHKALGVKIHSGPVDCSEALAVIRANSAGGAAAAAPWTCQYNSDEDTMDLLMLYCFNGNSRIVAPRQSK
jgi:hypothetical protein